MTDLLPWLNLLLLPIAGGVLKIVVFVVALDRRVTVLETRDEDRRAMQADGTYRHRRSTDPKPT
jgi:hypothetical protein